MIAIEETAQASFGRATKDILVETAEKSSAVFYRSAKSDRLEKAVAETSTARDRVREEFDAGLECYVNIKGRCVAAAETYDETKACRDQELADLKEVLKNLDVA